MVKCATSDCFFDKSPVAAFCSGRATDSDAKCKGESILNPWDDIYDFFARELSSRVNLMLHAVTYYTL